MNKLFEINVNDPYDFNAGVFFGTILGFILGIIVVVCILLYFIPIPIIGAGFASYPRYEQICNTGDGKIITRCIIQSGTSDE